MAGVVDLNGTQVVDEIRDLSLEDQDQGVVNNTSAPDETPQDECDNHHGICAICLRMIPLQETALVKGCEHAYCVNCILRWIDYKKEPICPQCKKPFEFLNIHRALDGSLHDYMFEESVSLLLRASWFKPMTVGGEQHNTVDDNADGFTLYDEYDNEEDDLNESYLGNSSSVRIGNRRWGDNGYVRAGRLEARPGPSPSRNPIGRRAKRALKREAAAAKHQL
ncbi:unnamed protein product [Cuscuta epithymum]|uniref:RING-type domain-containing protein n=1 Tax=Cuscuta epithymum TaxID=186058 RepID=A0AAV0FC11_9ASTE|nr:unnamed protein product [Cuscuta epithymum]CAH9133148.1 unnamed protein product [Cuscuta epithymum]